LNGHYENSAHILEAIDLFLQRGSGAKVLLRNWWDLIPDDLIAPIRRHVGIETWQDEHAALTGMSMMMCLAPKLVRKDRMVEESCLRPPCYGLFPPSRGLMPRSRMMYSAIHASREIGQKLIADHIADEMVNIARMQL
jgi:creatinine amidohydrolase/Fe(II)-dependent formamide hydrolase-like protein